MKRLLSALTFVALLACTLAAFAQTAPPADDATAAGAAAAQDATQPPAPADKAPAAEAPAPAAAPAPAIETAQAVPANEAAQPTTPAGAPSTATPEAAKAASSPLQPGTVIPLIVMDDVPLTDAIRNLARQSGINYMLDPRIGFGQVGPDGRPAAQPNVSIRWENITAEQALAALLNNYTLQMVEDPKSKIARITTKDPAAPPPLMTKIIQLRYAGPSNVLASAQSILLDKRSKVMPDNRTSQLVVIATEAEMADVEQLIERLDTQTKQVLIEARLIETSINPTTSKGVDWTGTLAGQNVSFGNGVTTGTGTSGNTSQNSSQSSKQTITTAPGTPITTTIQTPGGSSYTYTTTPSSDSSSTANSGSSSSASSSVNNVLNSVFGNAGFALNTANGFNPKTFFLNADGVKATLSFLNTYSETKVLSAPRTVTLDNEAAKIEVTRETPVINVTAGTANTTGGSSITYSNLGVILNVTPRISANDYVNLKVVPEVSRNAGTVNKIIAGQIFQADEYDVRRVETRVMIPSGNTLVMGGMISDSVNKGNTKVPILGDIPVLGYLFRSDTKSRLRQNLLIFITPTIVQDQDFQPTKSNFLKTAVPTSDQVEGEWSAWDSGKPKDWSKPKPDYYDSFKQPETTSSTTPPGQ
jgi:general secretion pathway protein D